MGDENDRLALLSKFEEAALVRCERAGESARSDRFKNDAEVREEGDLTSNTRAPTCASRADRGSSKAMMSASKYKARAMLTRWRCPPRKMSQVGRLRSAPRQGRKEREGRATQVNSFLADFGRVSRRQHLEVADQTRLLDNLPVPLLIELASKEDVVSNGGCRRGNGKVKGGSSSPGLRDDDEDRRGVRRERTVLNPGSLGAVGHLAAERHLAARPLHLSDQPL